MKSGMIIPSPEYWEYMSPPPGATKVEQAKFYIVRCTPRCGAFGGTGQVFQFIDQCANEINGPLIKEPIIPGESGMSSPIAVAMKMIARNHTLRSPEGQVAATYLVVTLESYLRRISGLLNDWDGKWIPPDGWERAVAILPERYKRKLNNRPERCNDVAITYELAIRNSKDPRAEHLLDLDRRIAADTGDINPYNIGRRISLLRHRAAHGNSIGVESDGIFYSLLLIVLVMTDPSWSAASV
jgi:hypothetical protein